jgi:hypothetical protein
MRLLSALSIALIFSLVSPALCQEKPEIFPPNEYTRRIARSLDLKLVKEVYILADSRGQSWDLTVTDPKVIALLVEGLKYATDTNYLNQTDGVVVIDKNNKILLEDNFYLGSPSHAISPQFIEGLKAAGIEPREWKEREAAAKAEQELMRRLFIFGPPFTLVALFALFVLNRRAAHRAAHRAGRRATHIR